MQSAYAPSGLDRVGVTHFLGLKPQALCLRPCGADFRNTLSAGRRQLALELVQEELLGGQGERRGGRPLEEARERQADAELSLQAMADTREEERAAAQGEEVALP